MKTFSVKKLLTGLFFLFFVSSAAPSNAFCSFDVDWGVSWDDGLTGHKQLAHWLVGNGYYANFNDAQNFALNGYIGHDAGDADPFYWNSPESFSFEMLQEIASTKDLNVLGYYTGSTNSKVLQQIFGGTENGPLSISIDEPFGLYLGTPVGNNLWYTDRAENADHQTGSLKRAGGNAQALIYELKPGTEWLVAWENRDAAKAVNSDRDYNDMYVKVTTVVAPEPIGSALFLIGGATLATLKIRKRKKA